MKNERWIKSCSEYSSSETWALTVCRRPKPGSPAPTSEKSWSSIWYSPTLTNGCLQNQRMNKPYPCTLHLWIKSERKHRSPTTSWPVSLAAFWFGFKVTASIWRAYWKPMDCPSSYKQKWHLQSFKIIQTKFLSQDTLPGSRQPQTQQVPLETMALTSLQGSENESCPAALAQDVGNLSLLWFTSGSFARIWFAMEWKGKRSEMHVHREPIKNFLCPAP